MGGEWELTIESPDILDLDEYQKELVELRKEYKTSFENSPDPGRDIEIFWYSDSVDEEDVDESTLSAPSCVGIAEVGASTNYSTAPKDNIFARFLYRPLILADLSDVTHQNNSTSCEGSNKKMRKKKVEELQGWTLFWNPKIVPEDGRQSNMNSRSAPMNFQRVSLEIQKKLTAKFPKIFQLEYDSYLTNRGFARGYDSDSDGDYDYTGSSGYNNRRYGSHHSLSDSDYAPGD